MVKSIDELQSLNESNKQKSKVVELVGIAGAGKSTLCRALVKQAPWIIKTTTPPVWTLSTASFYAKNLISLFPEIKRLKKIGIDNLSRRDLAFMAILNGWEKYLKKKANNGKEVFLIDQGAISLIAYLSIMGPLSLHDSRTHNWWENVFDLWRHNINAIVWLDAPIDILISRIHNRPQNHVIKYVPYQTANEWLSRYRAEYELIVSKLCAKNCDIQIIRLDSEKYSTEEMANMLISEFADEKTNAPI
ncbi:MAG TPA: AAA family ATPase [Anaerovoracaceae bacterium]|nr:AAA family ATPase [Anaerovoracaceae bacterium]